MTILTENVVEAVIEHEQSNPPPQGFAVSVGPDCFVPPLDPCSYSKEFVFMYRGHEVFYEPNRTGFVLENWKINQLGIRKD